jgi:signal transduction histidine kinase
MSAVLIVDDNPADRALFRTILRHDGFTVHEAATGAEVLAKAHELRPHAIILDVNLPDADGLEVCRALRADSQCAGIPVLMLTGRVYDEDVLAGLDAGADDYVAKDAPREILLARVRRLVHYRQMATTSVLNEQLAQIGRLLAGIVHEIRGPLSVIRGNAELLRINLHDADPNHQWIEPIIRNTQLLQVRLEHLMAAVRVGPSVLRTLEVGPVVQEAVDLFQKGTDPTRGRIEIELRLDEGLPPVRGDPGRLMQVFLNLLSNAHEAVQTTDQPGRLLIRARTERAKGQSWVLVQVADNGPGIPEHLIERIFEPFFTTKDTGSGYGLYLAREILREHAGQLTVRNLPEGGAEFTVWLPEVEGNAQ